MSIPGKIRTDYHSKQLKCHNSFNVPAINTEWWYVIKTPLFINEFCSQKFVEVYPVIDVH